MRHAHYKLLPHRERQRSRIPASYPALYSQQRRRRRLAFNSPPDILGLKLWLDPALGVTGIWADVSANGSSWIDYSSSAGYVASGYTHAIRIYPFKTVNGDRVYSARYLELQTADDSSSNQYYVNWSWDAVANAEGYRVLKSDSSSGYNFDYYLDVFDVSFIDTGSGLFTGGSTVLPQYETNNPAANDTISHWNDRSGSGNHATPLSLGQCASFQPNVLNGRGVLRFNSSAGYTTPLTLNKPCTVFAVYALNGAGDNARRAVQGSNNWLIGPYGPPHDFFNGSNFTGGPALTRGVFVAQAAWQNGSVSRNFVNGAFVGNALGAGTGPGVVGLGIGGAYAEGLDGDLAEVIAYDSALNDTKLANVWSYLAAKFHLP
jgi:hypothetical protein